MGGAQAAGEEILPVAFTRRFQATELLLDLDDPHLGNRPIADLGEPLTRLGFQFDVAGDLEQLRLGVLDVLTKEPEGKQRVAGVDGVTGEGVNLRDHTDRR